MPIVERDRGRARLPAGTSATSPSPARTGRRRRRRSSRHLLAGLGYDAVEAGNIGTPLAEIALRERQPEWIALEMSSFQLHDTPSIAPTVGVLTNLSADHLDRYASVEEYYADKALLFRNASRARVGDQRRRRRVQAMVARRRRAAPTASRSAPSAPTRTYDRAPDSSSCSVQPLIARERSAAARRAQRRERARRGARGDGRRRVAPDADGDRAQIADGAARLSRARAPARARRRVRRRPVDQRLQGDERQRRRSWRCEGMRVRPSSCSAAGTRASRTRRSPTSCERTVKHVIAYGEAAPIIETDLGG